MLSGKNLTDVIYVDFRKAFDKVLNQRLVEKLKSFGVTARLCRWVEGFVRGRPYTEGFRLIPPGTSAASFCLGTTGVPGVRKRFARCWVPSDVPSAGYRTMTLKCLTLPTYVQHWSWEELLLSHVRLMSVHYWKECRGPQLAST